MTGYLLWQAFTATTNSAMTTLADNRALLLKVKLPLELFILTRGCTALVNLGYSLIAYGVMLTVFRIPVHLDGGVFGPHCGASVSLFPGAFLWAAAAYVFYGDVRHLYSVTLTLWMYCSAHLLPGGPTLRLDPAGGGGKSPVPVHPLPAGGGDGGPGPRRRGHGADGPLGRGNIPAGWLLFRRLREPLLQRL